jgi:hypothetical protein
MSGDPYDYDFLLCCYDSLDPDVDGPHESEGAKDADELRDRMPILLKAGRFKTVVLYRWIGGDESEGDEVYEEIERSSVDDQWIMRSNSS